VSRAESTRDLGAQLPHRIVDGDGAHLAQAVEDAIDDHGLFPTSAEEVGRTVRRMHHDQFVSHLDHVTPAAPQYLRPRPHREYETGAGCCRRDAVNPSNGPPGRHHQHHLTGRRTHRTAQQVDPEFVDGHHGVVDERALIVDARHRLFGNVRRERVCAANVVRADEYDARGRHGGLVHATCTR
jgi:hypothetical protein